jgi:hypothetical protein
MPNSGAKRLKVMEKYMRYYNGQNMGKKVKMSKSNLKFQILERFMQGRKYVQARAQRSTFIVANSATLSYTYIELCIPMSQGQFYAKQAFPPTSPNCILGQLGKDN